MNSDVCIAHVLMEEGPYQCDAQDGGNWTLGMVGHGELKGTAWGISAHAYPDLDIRNLTAEAAAGIYRQDYWNPILGDLLPLPVAMVMLDAAVNSGVRRAVQWLQMCLNVLVDGEFGAKTLAAVEATNARDLAMCVSNKRLEFAQRTLEWARYGKGWEARIERVEKAALA